MCRRVGGALWWRLRHNSRTKAERAVVVCVCLCLRHIKAGAFVQSPLGGERLRLRRQASLSIKPGCDQVAWAGGASACAASSDYYVAHVGVFFVRGLLN